MIYFQCCKTTDLTTVGLSVDCVLPSVQFIIIKILLVQDPSYPPGRVRSKEEERQSKGASSSKRDSLGGSDQHQEDAFHFPPARGERPANTETYYAEQYDQYYR